MFIKHNILFLLFGILSTSANSQGVELIKSFVGNNEKSEIITFTPIEEVLLSGDYSGYINYWDVPNEALINSVKAHSGKINRIIFSENGELFLTFSSQDKQVKIWNFAGQDSLVNFSIKNSPYFAVFYDQSSVLIGDGNGTVYHKNFYYPEKDSIFYKNSSIAYDASFNKERNELVITDKNSIKIIDLNKPSKSENISRENTKKVTSKYEEKKVIFEVFNNHSSVFVKSMYFSSEILMTWSRNGIVSFWDLETKKVVKELRAKNDFHELSINQYSKVLLTGYYKDKALLFDLTNIDLKRELDENIQLVNTYLSNEKNQYMISSSEEGRHRLMQVKGGDGIRPLSLQTRNIEVHKTIIVESKKLTLSVWDNEKIDGDKISLSLNGEWILRNHEITEQKLVFEIDLRPNQENQLTFFAENLGDIPPNTSALNIQYEGFNKTLLMSSTLEKSGSINFIYSAN